MHWNAGGILLSEETMSAHGCFSGLSAVRPSPRFPSDNMYEYRNWGNEIHCDREASIFISVVKGNTLVFIAELFTVAKMWEQPECLLEAKAVVIYICYKCIHLGMYLNI